MKSTTTRYFLALIALCFSYQAFCQGFIHSANKDFLKALPAGEFEISPEKIYDAEQFTQVNSSVAFNGTAYLMVWVDNRSGMGLDIYGARMSPDGTLLDPSGIIISDADGDQQNPVVASNGDIFFVVWEDSREQAASGIDLYGARVSGQGVTMDPFGIEVNNEDGDQVLPSITSNQSDFLTLWVDDRSGNNDIYSTFITGNGVVAIPEGMVICDQAGWQNSPVAAWDGSRYFVVWSDQRGFSKDLYGTFLKTDGTISHSNGTGIVTLFNNQENPAVAWSGTQFFLAWEQNQAGALTKIIGSRMNTSGSLLDASGIVIASNPTATFTQPQVAAMDADFILSYSKGDGDLTVLYSVIASRISMDGTLLDPDGISVTPGNSLADQQPAIAFSGTEALITWTSSGQGQQDIYAGRVNPTGTVQDPQGLLVTKGYNAQLFTDVAFDGTNYLAVWCDTRDGNGLSLYATRISDGGAILDPAGIEIIQGDANMNNPSVAFNGTNYLIVWEMNKDIYGARIDKLGNVLDNAGFVIYQDNTVQEMPAVSSDGQNWMVVWQDDRNNSAREAYADIYGAVVLANGTVQQPSSIPVVTFNEDQVNPDIVFGNNQYMVVWEDHRAGNGGQPNIFGTRVASDGTVMDFEGIGIAMNTEMAMQDPSVAFDGTNYLVCWYSGLAGDYNVQGIRIDQSVNALDAGPIILSNSPRNQYMVSLDWNTEHYVVLWMDQTGLMKYRISMAKVLPDGSIAETGILSELEGNMVTPVIAHGPLKQVLTAFSYFMKISGETPMNAMRAMGFLIGQGQGPGITENESGIISGFDVFPNPADDKISIEFELVDRTNVSVDLLTVEGRKVKTLLNCPAERGNTSMTISLPGLPKGIYYICLKAGPSTIAQKLILTGKE